MHDVLVNRLGGLSLPRKSVVRLTDHPDMTLDVYRGRKTTIQYNIMYFCVIAATVLYSGVVETSQDKFLHIAGGFHISSGVRAFMDVATELSIAMSIGLNYCFISSEKEPK